MSLKKINPAWLVWATYASFYLGRLNLSPALPSIAKALDISRAEVGILGTVFFWTYAFGQFVNGQLGTYFSPRKIVAVGLGTIAITNILFSVQSSLWIMAILWSINGFAQSTGWGPMSRILSERLSLEQRQRFSTIFPMSFQFGTAVSWAFAGVLIAIGSWQTAFIVPGLILIGVLVVWWVADVDAPFSDQKFEVADLRQDISDYAPLLVSSLFLGFVHVGSLIWIPTYFADTDLFPEALIGTMAAITPIVGAFGMLMAGILVRRLGKVLYVMNLFLAVCIFSLLLAALTNSPLQILFVALTMCLLGGSVAVLLGSVPITLARTGRTSSLAGTITAMLNVGGGMAGFLVGGIVESYSWNTVFAIWSVSIAVALVLIYQRGKNERGHPVTVATAT